MVAGEWVEVEGISVEVAVKAALEELGIEKDRAEVEILQEPQRGFLGIGRQDAIVRVKPQPRPKRARRGRFGRKRRPSGQKQPSGRRPDRSKQPVRVGNCIGWFVSISVLLIFGVAALLGAFSGEETEAIGDGYAPTTSAAPTTTTAPTTSAAPTTTTAPTTSVAPTTTTAPTTSVAPTTTTAPTTSVAPTTTTRTSAAPTTTTRTSASGRLRASDLKKVSCGDWPDRGTVDELRDMVRSAGSKFNWGRRDGNDKDGYPCETQIGSGYAAWPAS